MKLTIEEALRQGVAAHEEGKLEDAERFFRAILQSQPEHPDANHNLGVIAVSVNKTKAALPLFKTALEANPKIEQFWLSYIHALIKEQQVETAKQVLQKARTEGVREDRLTFIEAQLSPATQKPKTASVGPPKEILKNLLGQYQNRRYRDAEKLALGITEEFPGDQFAWKVLGAVQRATGRKSDAVDAYQKAVALSPQDAEAHNNLGNALRELGRLDEALVRFKEAITLKPDYVAAHNNLGNALRELGRLDEALVRFKEAITLKPDHAEIHCDLGVTLQELGRLDEAEASYNQAIALKPDYVAAHNNLGNALRELRRLDEALVRFKEAITLKPDHAEIHCNLGVTLQELGRLDEAEASYNQAIALKPEHAEAHYILGNLLNELGRPDDAEASFNKAIALKPDYADAHCNLGNTLKGLGRLEDAKACYKQAVTLNPYLGEAHNNLGNSLRELGRLDEAVISFKEALALNPEYAEIHSNLGVTLQELGKLEEAEASYNQSITLKPNYAEAHYNLGSTLQELGRADEAVSSYQQAFIKRTDIRGKEDDILHPATTSLYFELTNECNFHCTFCPSDSQTRDIGFMDLELIQRLYEEAADKKISPRVNLHLMGEPTLHPKLLDILSFGASKNIKTGLVTNGSTLIPKVVSKLLDSIYGTITASHMTPTQETYKFRGKVKLPWNRYISNLRSLVREYMKRSARGDAIKNDIIIRVMATQNTASNVIVTDTPNEALAILKEWSNFVAELEEELGMTPFRRKDPNAYNILQDNRNKLISYPLQKGIKLTFWRAFTFANTRVSEDFELERRKDTAYCPHPFTDVGVLWNGDVTLCCLDHDGELKVGNVKDSSIEAVIQSEAARKLRGSMLGHHPLPSVCQTCQAKPVRREEVGG